MDFKLIKRLLIEKFLESEFQDCFLIDIEYNKVRNKLEVFIDSDSGFGFDKCKKISRHLENHFDQSGILGNKYILEVSSPGLDRPLKLPRQYANNLGRNVRIYLHDGSRLEGQILEVKDLEVTLVNKDTKTTVPMKNIKSTKVLASFK